METQKINLLIQQYAETKQQFQNNYINDQKRLEVENKQYQIKIKFLIPMLLAQIKRLEQLDSTTWKDQYLFKILQNDSSLQRLLQNNYELFQFGEILHFDNSQSVSDSVLISQISNIVHQNIQMVSVISNISQQLESTYSIIKTQEDALQQDKSNISNYHELKKQIQQLNTKLQEKDSEHNKQFEQLTEAEQQLKQVYNLIKQSIYELSTDINSEINVVPQSLNDLVQLFVNICKNYSKNMLKQNNLFKNQAYQARLELEQVKLAHSNELKLLYSEIFTLSTNFSMSQQVKQVAKLEEKCNQSKQKIDVVVQKLNRFNNYVSQQQQNANDSQIVQQKLLEQLQNQDILYQKMVKQATDKANDDNILKTNFTQQIIKLNEKTTHYYNQNEELTNSINQLKIQIQQNKEVEIVIEKKNQQIVSDLQRQLEQLNEQVKLASQNEQRHLEEIQALKSSIAQKEINNQVVTAKEVHANECEQNATDQLTSITNNVAANENVEQIFQLKQENSAMQQKLAQLETNNSDLVSKLKTLQEQCDQLNKSNCVAPGSEQTETNETSQLQQQNEQLVLNAQQLESSVQKLNLDIQQLQLQYEQAAADKSAIQQKYQEIQQNRSQSLNDTTNDDIQIDDGNNLSSQIEDLQNQLTQQTANVNNLVEQKHTILEKFQESVLKLKALEVVSDKNESTLFESVQKLEQDIEQIVAYDTDIIQDISRLRDFVVSDEVKQMIDIKDSEIKQLKDKIERTPTKETEGNVTSTQNTDRVDVNDLQRQLEQLNEQVKLASQNEQRHLEEIQALKSSIAQKEINNQVVTAKEVHANECEQNATDQLTSITNNVAANENVEQIFQLKQENSAMQQKLAQLETNNSDLVSKLKTLQEQCDQLNKSNCVAPGSEQTETNETSQLQQQNEQLVLNAQQLESSVQKLNLDIQQLQLQYEQAAADKSAIQQKYQEIQQNRSQSLNDTTNDDIQIDDGNNLSSQIEDLQNQLTQQTANVNNLVEQKHTILEKFQESVLKLKALEVVSDKNESTLFESVQKLEQDIEQIVAYDTDIIQDISRLRDFVVSDEVKQMIDIKDSEIKQLKDKIERTPTKETEGNVTSTQNTDRVDVNDLQRQLEQLNEQVKLASQNEQRHLEEIQALKSSIAQKEINNQVVTAKEVHANECEQNATDQLTSITNNVAANENVEQIFQLKQENSAMQQKLAQLETNNSDLVSKLKTLQEQCDQLNKSNCVAPGSEQTETNETSQLQQQNEQLVLNAQQLESSVQKLNLDIQQLQLQYEQAAADKSAIQQKYQEIQQNRSQSLNDTTNDDIQIDDGNNLSSQIEDLQNQLTQQTANVNNLVEQKHTILEKFQESVLKLKALEVVSDKNESTLFESVQKLEQDIEQIVAYDTDIIQDISRLRDFVVSDEVKQMIDIKDSEIKQLKDKIERTPTKETEGNVTSTQNTERVDVNDLQRQLEQLNEQVKLASQNEQRHLEEIQALKSSIVAYEQTNISLQKELKKKKGSE
ncbi:Hypothetical_protein [Hexamita inflata]|uniref:Hypothetical_protein n=1 Tax=Hexamita inflata TaxID=28002 RepID=A0AA86THP3_9EUKA|nr:Hypothetical protein HINF_LOCUS6539 [Hexamita inflata]